MVLLSLGTCAQSLQVSVDERTRKRRMIAGYVSQAGVLAGFDLSIEKFRPQPNYDFTIICVPLVCQPVALRGTAPQNKRVRVVRSSLDGEAGGLIATNDSGMFMLSLFELPDDAKTREARSSIPLRRQKMRELVSSCVSGTRF